MDITSVGNPVQLNIDTGERVAPVADPTAVSKAAAAPVETTAAVQQPGAIPTLDQVAQAVKSINKAMEDKSPSLEFSVDNDDHRTIVKVVDQQTNKVLLQIPSEDAIEIAKALDQAQGLLIKQKA